MNQPGDKPIFTGPETDARSEMRSVTLNARMASVLAAVAILVLTIAAYWPVTRAGFIWDDDDYVTGNPTLHSMTGLSRIWLELGASPQYYPLVFTTYWLEYRLWGLNPVGYHVVNVLLHGLGAVLLWIVLKRLKLPGAWLAAALWALHPVQVESVAWVTERKNVLSGVFYFASALAYLRFVGQTSRLPVEAASCSRQSGAKTPRETEPPLPNEVLRVDSLNCGAPPHPSLSPDGGEGGVSPGEGLVHGEGKGGAKMPREPSGWKPDPQSGSWHWYFAALLLFVCALLSKTVTCSLPVALLLVQWWKKGRLCRSDAVPLVPFFVIGAGLGLLTVWMEKHHVQAQGEDWSQNFVERCLIAGRVLWFYAGKLAWPAQLTFVYPRWEIDTGAWQQWLFPVFAVVAVAVCWLIRGRIDRGPFVAVLFFAATLCPAMGFIDVYPMRYSFVADHFQYLAGIGLIALITAGLGRSRNYFGALVLPVLLILTWRQTHTYRDAETLWRDTLVKNPSCWMAHNNLGLLLKRRGDWEEAETHLREALKLKPASHEYLNNLGQVLANRQKFAEAITCYESALKLAPADTFVHYNFANTLFELGRIDEAIDHYRKAIQSGPDYPLVHDRLGIALLTKGETDEAMIQFGEELRVNPDNAQVCYKLGLLLAAKGEKPEAIVRLREAVRLKPDSVEYLNSLAWLLATAADGRLRNGAEAIGFARRAADLSQFKNPFVLDTLAAAYAESGRFAEAVETAQMAAALATAADKETAAGIAARLDIYRSGQAYKE